ncbi:hypothetical protein SAMN05428976_10919 [Clostridium sp. USBA 49]|jgi:hypothetical protein|uniref:hypothetical protein n=1 Tax=Clostridium sp. USBA 49 TaxID=1881060 RepID=UPI00099A1159|nr:hypothetical protein [Clostridium sp. USBA 49]SKA86901.1 hypothetical protein SAMN05428976_10919 [Clostridium sp. USBA 49]
MTNKENSLISLLVDNNSVNNKPETVYESNEHKYIDIIESLIAIIKDLNIKIDNLKKETESLRKRNK